MNSDMQSLLAALGDGATREHAERALTWMNTHHTHHTPRGVKPDRIAGLAEVAAHTGQSIATVNNWIARGTHNFPPPIAKVAATNLWDLDQVEQWCVGNPQIVRKPTNGGT